jgi:hypothetical protein
MKMVNQQQQEEEKSKQWIEAQLDEMRKKGVPENKIDEWRLRYEDDHRHARIYELGTKAYEEAELRKKSKRKK